jgi:hypothetical protein
VSVLRGKWYYPDSPRLPVPLAQHNQPLPFPCLDNKKVQIVRTDTCLVSDPFTEFVSIVRTDTGTEQPR